MCIFRFELECIEPFWNELEIIKKDYFSVNDPFIEDVGSDEMKKIGDLFSVGEAPEDDAPVEDHENYQKSKVLKLHKFDEKLKLWDKEKDVYDKKSEEEFGKEQPDPEIVKLFSLWKGQRNLTLNAIDVSGENDAQMSEGWLIFNAGCTTCSDGSGLPGIDSHVCVENGSDIFISILKTHCEINETVNISTNELILKMIKEFITVVNTQIEHSGLPAGVCLARSSLDGYCPPDQVEFIQSEVLKSLASLFEAKNATLNISKPYLTTV